MAAALAWFGVGLTRFLVRATDIHGTGPALRPEPLLACLKPGDVHLVEGNSRISTAINYLTQSTWSHAALHVGAHLAAAGGNSRHGFIEADMVKPPLAAGFEFHDLRWQDSLPAQRP